ncbi:hypothetical protein YC2023_089627 [Brassica napus]
MAGDEIDSIFLSREDFQDGQHICQSMQQVSSFSTAGGVYNGVYNGVNSKDVDDGKDDIEGTLPAMEQTVKIEKFIHQAFSYETPLIN